MLREDEMNEEYIFKPHHFKGERIELNSKKAIRRYPFWNQLPKVDIDPAQLFLIIEVRFYDEMLDEIPEDLDRSTRFPLGKKLDRVFLAFKDGHIEELPIRPTEIRLSPYNGDPPNDHFIPGRSLRETFEIHSIPWQESSFILWHSQGKYADGIWDEMLRDVEIRSLRDVIKGGKPRFKVGSIKWNNLEIIPIRQRRKRRNS